MVKKTLLLLFLAALSAFSARSQPRAGVIERDFTALTAAGYAGPLQPLVNNGASIASRHLFQIKSTSVLAACTLALEVRRNSGWPWVDVTSAFSVPTDCLATPWFHIQGQTIPEFRVHLSTLTPSEILSDNNLSGSNWAGGGDCTVAAGVATCAFATGTGTLTQAVGDFDVAATAGETYVLQYTVGALTGTPTCAVTTSFADASTPLTIASGTQTATIVAKGVPSDLVISCMLVATETFTLDDITLTAAPSVTVGYTGASN